MLTRSGAIHGAGDLIVIIWGWRRTVQRVATLPLFCRVCNGTYATAVNKSVRMFTLFFIPLFPISTRHSLTCTSCGTVQMINSASAQQLRQQQAYQQMPPQQQMQNQRPAPPPGYPQQIQNQPPPGYSPPQQVQRPPQC
jgi:hypothetical protein